MILMSLAIVILLMFFVFCIEILLPLQIKFEMNGICRSYIYQIESKGYLTHNEEVSLKKALEGVGLNQVEIDIKADGNKYGDKVVVSIKSIYQQNRMVTLFRRQEEHMVMSFERIYFIRKIKN